MRKPHILQAIVIGICGAAVVPLAQSPGDASFEVASIKPNRAPDRHGMMYPSPGGRFTAINVNLRALIRLTYKLHDFQIEGGPKWIDTDGFDVLARATKNTTYFGPELRSLLTDRFKLRVHHEQRERPVYALVIARSDRKLGRRLRKSEIDCQVVMNRAFQAGLPLPPVNRCGANPLLGHLRAGGITMSELAVNFSRFMDRIVIDQTGLAGGFDVELEWTPDQIPPDTPPEALPAPNGPSIFTAVEEQLGLKLRSTKAMIDVLVIDHAERPNYN